ncbi:MAG: lipopolysaccharide kinase InaA family protein [bacterium]
MTAGALPAGYVRVTAGRCAVVVLEALADDARALLDEGSLYEAAARDLGAHPLQGRGAVYSIALPRSGRRAVVRRNRHGGVFGALTRDLFLPPTRAPYELAMSLRLRAAHVRTPAVLMYGVERMHGVLRHADVVTAEVSDGRDLATYMQPGEDAVQRADAWRATVALVQALGAAGARHHDLNVKNILLAPAVQGLAAWVLDVDRVTFGDPASVHRANVARLLRSARKWRGERGAELEEGVFGPLAQKSGD